MTITEVNFLGTERSLVETWEGKNRYQIGGVPICPEWEKSSGRRGEEIIKQAAAFLKKIKQAARSSVLSRSRSARTHGQVSNCTAHVRPCPTAGSGKPDN